MGQVPLLDPETAAETGRRVVDVRQTAEWATGHLPGAVHVELAAVSDHPTAMDGTPVLTQCGHGERAMTAASLLARAGHRDVAVLAGGPSALAAGGGQELAKTR